MASDRDPVDDTTVLVEREKSKRLYVVIGAGTSVALAALVLFFTSGESGRRSIVVDPTKGSVQISFDEPISVQADVRVDTVRALGDTVRVSAATVADSLVRQVEAKASEPGAFVGSNMVDRSLGVVVASAAAKKWSVTKRSLDGELALRSTDSSTLRVRVSALPRGTSIQPYVDSVLTHLRTSAASRSTPGVRVDSTSALLWYVDRITGHAVCQRLIIANGQLYTARAESFSSDKQATKDVIEMASTFSVIAQPVTKIPTPSAALRNAPRR